jgi:hypothetical protein
MTRVHLAAIALLFVFSAPAYAILTRADRDDAEYLELATRYTSSVSLGTQGGEGVLIAPRWVLTAAHRAKAMQEMTPLPKLRIGERDFEVQATFLNPGWKAGGENDLALILLRQPVRGVEPTRLYRDADEAGKTLVIVGHGHTGPLGATPPAKGTWDRKKRAAINTVDRVMPRILGMQIKKADEASDLQGAATPGDSGGPAYLQTDDGLFVAGIGIATGDRNADGILGNAGDWESYTRVSAFVPWIEGVMLEEAKREAQQLLDAR